MTAHAHGPSDKAQWRARLLAARRALAPQVRARRAVALTLAAVRLADEIGGPVCAHVPIGTEPGSPELVEALHAAGHEVLLPVVTGAAPLDWARYEGAADLVPAALGLREPAGPRLGPGAVARARLVLLPALAADLAGVRLGRGAGHYDRTLGLVTPGTPLVVVLNDDELVPQLPAEPHDRRVTAALLPEAGLRPVGKNR